VRAQNARVREIGKYLAVSTGYGDAVAGISRLYQVMVKYHFMNGGLLGEFDPFCRGLRQTLAICRHFG
jgi:hypothetical protein